VATVLITCIVFCVSDGVRRWAGGMKTTFDCAGVAYGCSWPKI
jgi:hypothetical protein